MRKRKQFENNFLVCWPYTLMAMQNFIVLGFNENSKYRVLELSGALMKVKRALRCLQPCIFIVWPSLSLQLPNLSRMSMKDIQKFDGSMAACILSLLSFK